MKLKLLDVTNKEIGKIDMPSQFSEPLREDMIKRAVLAIQSHNRQPYGADPEAGLRASADLSKRRRKYRGSYGTGQSRTPRKVLSRNGTRFYFVGALAPQTVGGRRSHPPKPDKIWDLKINIQERRKAVRSALAAAVNADVVSARGHLLPEGYPFVADDAICTLKTAKAARKTLSTLGFGPELERTEEKKTRAGKGKSRGRRNITKKGLLLVVSADCPLMKACSNLPGVEVVSAKNINAELLAPGAVPGRITLFTRGAIDSFEKDSLFKIKKIRRKPAAKDTLVKEAAPKEKKSVAKKTPAKKAAAPKKKEATEE